MYAVLYDYTYMYVFHQSANSAHMVVGRCWISDIVFDEKVPSLT